MHNTNTNIATTLDKAGFPSFSRLSSGGERKRERSYCHIFEDSFAPERSGNRGLFYRNWLLLRAITCYLLSEAKWIGRKNRKNVLFQTLSNGISYTVDIFLYTYSRHFSVLRKKLYIFFFLSRLRSSLNST